MIQRRALLRAAAAASLLPLPFAAARAQAHYPSKPIKLVVPLPAGGAADISGRLLGEAMAASLGQPIVADNRPGGLFTIGMQALAGAPADGYTLIHLNPVMCSVQAVHKRFDLRQLSPIGLMGATDMLIMASGKAPFKTMPEMLRWAQANPGRLNYGTLGVGSLEHLTMVTLLDEAGAKGTNVPFKGGPDGAVALAQDEIHVMPLATPLYVQFKERLVPLAVNRTSRSPFVPDVSTLAELRINAPATSYWGGLAAAPGTPPEVVAVLAKAMEAAVGSPELKKRFAPMGLGASFESGKELQRRIAADLAWMTEAARTAQVSTA